MVDVGVGQDKGIDGGRVKVEPQPVFKLSLFSALKETAVHQDLEFFPVIR